MLTVCLQSCSMQTDGASSAVWSRVIFRPSAGSKILAEGSLPTFLHTLPYLVGHYCLLRVQAWSDRCWVCDCQPASHMALINL